jgi:hypothetical protein
MKYGDGLSRQERAEELFARLVRGPSFGVGLGRDAFTHEKAAAEFRQWSESWILTDLCRLVPELREKLDHTGYCQQDAIREQLP